jgi:hypothetical protein
MTAYRGVCGGPSGVSGGDNQGTPYLRHTRGCYAYPVRTARCAALGAGCPAPPVRTVRGRPVRAASSVVRSPPEQGGGGGRGGRCGQRAAGDVDLTLALALALTLALTPTLALALTLPMWT